MQFQTDIDAAGERFPVQSAALRWIYSHPRTEEPKLIFNPLWSRSDRFLMIPE